MIGCDLPKEISRNGPSDLHRATGARWALGDHLQAQQVFG